MSKYTTKKDSRKEKLIHLQDLIALLEEVTFPEKKKEEKDSWQASNSF